MTVGIDAGTWLDSLPAGSADSVITSPPYWCQRRYGDSGAELGTEPEVRDYVANLVATLDRARRVLKPSGWLCVNLGDTYANQPGGYRFSGTSKISGANRRAAATAPRRDLRGLPYKSLACVPDRVKLAMIDRGWVLRNVIVWAKGNNPLPATTTDRWWSAWEPILAFTPGPRGAWWSCDAPDADWGPHGKLDVWTVSPSRRRGAADHPAGMPARIVSRLVRQTCPVGGTVLDPFAGGGTTLVVASAHSRHAHGCDLYQWPHLSREGLDVIEWTSGSREPQETTNGD